MLSCLEPMAERGKEEFTSIVRDLLADAEIELDENATNVFCYPPPFGILNYLVNADCTVHDLVKIAFDENGCSQKSFEIDDSQISFLPNVGSVKSTAGALTVGGGEPALDVLASDGKVELSRNLKTSFLDISILSGCDDFVRGSIGGSGDQCSFFPANKETQDRFDKAIELISLLSPSMFQILSEHVRYIVAFKGSRDSSSYADLAFHGALFINLERTWSPATLAADILHQTAHVYLTIATIDSERLFADSAEQTVEEAIGATDRRTLYSAFHGLFTAYVEKNLYQQWLQSQKDANAAEVLQIREKLAEKSESFSRDYKLFETLRDENILIGDGAEILRHYSH